MPRIWSETVESHRRAVHDAVLDAAAAIVAKDGITAVNMARIAEASGIGRATLYKYFPDVERVLLAWHERQVSRHLAELEALATKEDAPRAQLKVVLEGFAARAVHDHASSFAALLHRGRHVEGAHARLQDFVRDIIAAGAGSAFRDDVQPAELAKYCLHAVTAASVLGSKAAVARLVDVTISGLEKRKNE
jgi:AcrR family transcriptional regulator